MSNETIIVAQTPATLDPDPGTSHLYGIRFTLNANATVQVTGRYWYVAGSGAGWGLWNDDTNTAVHTQTIDPLTLTPGGFNDINLGATFDLVAGNYVVYGLWVGTSPYTTPFSFPFDGSGGPTGLLTAIGGTFGFGAVTAGPRAGGGGNFSILPQVDLSVAAVSVTQAIGESDVTVTAAGTPTRVAQAAGVSTVAVTAAGSAIVVRQAIGASVVAVAAAGTAVRVVEASGRSSVSVADAGVPTRVAQAQGAAGVSVTISGQARRVVQASGASAVRVTATGTPTGSRVRPSRPVATSTVGGLTASSILAAPVAS